MPPTDLTTGGFIALLVTAISALFGLLIAQYKESNTRIYTQFTALQVSYQDLLTVSNDTLKELVRLVSSLDRKSDKNLELLNDSRIQDQINAGVKKGMLEAEKVRKELSS